MLLEHGEDDVENLLLLSPWQPADFLEGFLDLTGWSCGVCNGGGLAFVEVSPSKSLTETRRAAASLGRTSERGGFSERSQKEMLT